MRCAGDMPKEGVMRITGTEENMTEDMTEVMTKVMIEVMIEVMTEAIIEDIAEGMTEIMTEVTDGISIEKMNGDEKTYHGIIQGEDVTIAGPQVI